MVIIYPVSTPQISSTTLTNGLTQLVVHDALDKIRSASVIVSSLPPKTTILISSPFEGPKRTTLLAPAFKCPPAVSVVKKKPVHSRTTSTLRSAHGSFSGDLSDSPLIF